MATITQTRSGTWKAVVRRAGWPTAAKTFRTKRDAIDWSRQAEDEMVRGVFINRADSHRLSVEHAVDRYLAEISPMKRATTAIREKRRVKIVKERLGSFSLAALTPELIGKYRDERLGEGMSASSVRLELALLAHLYTVAIREWRLGLIYNPVSLVRKPSPPPGRDRRLQKPEEKALLQACDAHSNPMLGWIVRTALHTGMRQSEIQSLRLSQVDLDKRVIRLAVTKNGSARTVPLTKAATSVLRKAMKNPARPKDVDLVFFGAPGWDGVRRGYEFKPAWFDAVRKAGIEGFRFHDLRHEAVSRFVEAGLTDQRVSSISGHRSMQMLKRYTHLRAEDLVAHLDEAGL
jgi:integrase